MTDERYDFDPPDVGRLFRVDGEVALVTGGGTGIGRMAARVLARAGAKVIVTDIDGAAAERVAAEITGEGLAAASYAMDVAREADIVSVFDAVRRDHAPVSILFNNAGISKRAPAEELTLEAWNAVLDVNLTGVFLCAREAGKHMLGLGRGSIINVSSMWGHAGGGYYGNASYHATKSAVIGLTRALAVEWGPRGIRVNDIAPTFLKTRITEPLFANPDMLEDLEAFAPLRRTGVPADLAGAVLYLASPASGLVTGASLRVDAGWTAR
ncbi:MAG: SDR family oxidoreductase [Hyphomicrobiaceae bacterium]|nr:SDR family oxidoreductase [Hyphomicrobiaceae bacterium]